MTTFRSESEERAEELARLRQMIENARRVLETTPRPEGSAEARLANDVWVALGGASGVGSREDGAG